MDRPEIRLKLRTIDHVIEATGVVCLACLILISIIYFDKLPDRIPQHFNLSGEPDSYAGRGFIWFLPILGTILYIGMTFLTRYPHIYNYPMKVTPDNAERLYTIGTRTIRVLKVFITTTFMLLNLKTIDIGLNNSDGLGVYFLPSYFLIMTLLIGIPIYLMRKLKVKDDT